MGCWERNNHESEWSVYIYTYILFMYLHASTFDLFLQSVWKLNQFRSDTLTYYISCNMFQLILLVAVTGGQEFNPFHRSKMWIVIGMFHRVKCATIYPTTCIVYQSIQSKNQSISFVKMQFKKDVYLFWILQSLPNTRRKQLIQCRVAAPTQILRLYFYWSIIFSVKFR